MASATTRGKPAAGREGRVRGPRRRGPDRILFLTGHLPCPPLSGGRRREYELLTRLGAEFEIHLRAVTKTIEEDRRHLEDMLESCASVRLFPAEDPPLDSIPASGRVAPQVARHRSTEASLDVVEALATGRFQAVHVEGFYLMQHLPGSRPPTLLVEQNVEHDLWRQRARAARSGRARGRFLAWARATLDAERRAWRGADLCAALTEDDRAAMRADVPGLDVRLVPDGIDHCSGFGTAPSGWTRPDQAAQGDPTLVMVGNFGYEPNVDAAVHLVRDVFPRVLRRLPSARLLLVGTSPPPQVRALGAGTPNVVVTGRVPAVEPFLDAADVVLCPLRVGGGVKVKVLEALARGKAIVTTSVGVQGLGAKGRSCVRLADDPGRFATAVVDLIERPAERARLENAATAFAAGLPSWDESARALARCYREVTALNAGARAA